MNLNDIVFNILPLQQYNGGFLLVNFKQYSDAMELKIDDDLSITCVIIILMEQHGLNELYNMNYQKAVNYVNNNSNDNILDTLRKKINSYI